MHKHTDRYMHMCVSICMYKVVGMTLQEFYPSQGIDKSFFPSQIKLELYKQQAYIHHLRVVYPDPRIDNSLFPT